MTIKMNCFSIMITVARKGSRKLLRGQRITRFLLRKLKILLNCVTLDSLDFLSFWELLTLYKIKILLRLAKWLKLYL
jgi:hypothetical protein